MSVDTGGAMSTRPSVIVIDDLVFLDFRRVHPRTERWWIERLRCRRCAHALRDRPPALFCSVTPPGVGQQRAYCIDARDKGACGPDGLLFKPAARLP